MELEITTRSLIQVTNSALTTSMSSAITTYRLNNNPVNVNGGRSVKGGYTIAINGVGFREKRHLRRL